MDKQSDQQTQQQEQDSQELTRREFVHTTSMAASAGALLASMTANAEEKKPEDINIAMIGCGSQGLNLIRRSVKTAGIRYKALCDIWSYSQRYSKNYLKAYKHIVNVYSDYREMLAQEKGLDAVIIATPDWMHAEHTIACLKAGLHVYCEKEMSNTIEGARSMVVAARESGKLLQIGHQRRSNIRYHHAIKLITKDKILGQINHFSGQWNRARRLDVGWPKKEPLDDAILKEFGYDTMERFRNWRWYRKYSGGPIADLGSHQVDIFNWFLKANPKAVMASGGTDYYKKSEWYDNIIAIYEYEKEYGTVRGTYQVLNTTSHGGFYETFMGDQGSMVISEDTRKGFFFREVTAKRREWEEQSETFEKMDKKAFELKIGETLTPDGKKDPKGQKLLEESKKRPHRLHLENFFSAIRNVTPLTCPAEVGFETAVSVLRVNEAVESEQKYFFKPDEFKA